MAAERCWALPQHLRVPRSLSSGPAGGGDRVGAGTLQELHRHIPRQGRQGASVLRRRALLVSAEAPSDGASSPRGLPS